MRRSTEGQALHSEYYLALALFPLPTVNGLVIESYAEKSMAEVETSTAKKPQVPLKQCCITIFSSPLFQLLEETRKSAAYLINIV